MADVSEDIKDIRNSVAYNFLTDLEKEGKIDPAV